jgi:hypothetical protein
MGMKTPAALTNRVASPCSAASWWQTRSTCIRSVRSAAMPYAVPSLVRDWTVSSTLPASSPMMTALPPAATTSAAAQLKELVDGTDALSKDKRAELRGVISNKPGLNRYLRVTPGGLLRVDPAKAKAEENLDGKYLLRTSDPAMTAEDIALGYKQLLEVERGWRDMKQVIDLRPVYHRKEDRIRAHVILCWLALLLARVAENATRSTWPQLRRQLDRIAVGTFTGSAGTFRQRTEISPAQAAILEQLGIDPLLKIYQLTPAVTG